MNWLIVGGCVGVALLVAFGIALRRWFTVEQTSVQPTPPLADEQATGEQGSDEQA